MAQAIGQCADDTVLMGLAQMRAKAGSAELELLFFAVLYTNGINNCRFAATETYE